MVGLHCVKPENQRELEFDVETAVVIGQAKVDELVEVQRICD
jgi:hypothetical protein